MNEDIRGVITIDRLQDSRRFISQLQTILMAFNKLLRLSLGKDR